MRYIPRMMILLILIGLVGAPPLAAETATPPQSYIYLPLVTHYRDPNNLELFSASYLGGSADDGLHAIDITSNGELIAGGILQNYSPPNITTVHLPGATSGVVLQISANGQQPKHLTWLGGVVEDLQLTSNDQILACGDFGIAMLSSNGNNLIWSQNPGSTSRCSSGSDGMSAALTNQHISIYSATGELIKEWSLTDPVNDLVIDHSNAQVILVGYRQITAQLQMPFIRAYGYDGTLHWQAYDYAAGTPNIGTADTRAERVAIGDDGKLYVGFSINGGTGASVLSRDPQNPAISAADRTVITDQYTNPYNVGSVSMAWFGRFDPKSGSLLLGQSLLTRLSNGKGNSISIRAIAADLQGRVAIAGDTYCCIANRTLLTVAGVAVGNYEAGEPYLLIVGSDFQKRIHWSTFAGSGASAGGSPVNAVAISQQVVALGLTLNQKSGVNRQLITQNAFQPTLGSTNASDGYILVAPSN